MIHAQQKGHAPAEILRGLCDAVARNFKSSVVKGRPVEAPVALVGAVSQNAGVTAALREAFGLSADQLFVPAEFAWCGAIGAAMLEAEEPRKRSLRDIHRLNQHEGEERVEDTTPLSMKNVVLLRESVGVYVAPKAGQRSHPGIPGHRCRIGVHQLGGDRRNRRGDSRYLSADLGPADRGGAAGLDGA